MRVARKFLTSQLASVPWLLANIIVKYMDIISRVLARHTTSNLIVMDGPCLLEHMKKGENSTYVHADSKLTTMRVATYMAIWLAKFVY